MRLLLAVTLVLFAVAARGDSGAISIQARALSLRAYSAVVAAQGAAAQAQAAADAAQQSAGAASTAASAASSTAQAAYTKASSAMDSAAVSAAIAAATGSLAPKSSIPTAATTAPLAETVGGSAGTMTQVYALANHTHPRITWSGVVVTLTGGTFSGSFPPTFFSAAPVISLTWVNTGALFMTCELTSDPTTAAFAGRCRSNSLTAILAAGAGFKVHVLALPASPTS